MATIPTYMPNAIRAGDTTKFTYYDSDYLPASYTLTLSLADSSSQFNVTATDNADGKHLVTIASGITAQLNTGTYSYQISVAGSSERYTLQTGTVDVKADMFSAASGVDARSHATKMYEALKATSEGKATKDQLSYSIGAGAGSVSIGRMSPADLIQWLDYYKRLVNQEEAAERLSKGLDTNRTVRIRFTG